jgi:tetratricopeptide (TPR) repeat protein
MKSPGWWQLVIVLGAMGVVVASPLAATAQQAFTLTPVSPTLAGVSKERLAEWVQLATDHAPGSVDGASISAVGFTLRELGAVLWAVQMGRLPTDRKAVEHLIARGAVLHTDAAAAQMRAAAQPDRASSGGLAFHHFGMAAELVAVLQSRLTTEAFVHAWYRTVAAVLASEQEVSVTPAFLDRALARFPDDPQLLLLAGAARELRASPRVQDATDLGWTHGGVGGAADNLRRAETYYRRAVKSAPLQVEARVRLARVLGLTGRHADAVAELEIAGRECAAAHDRGTAVDPQVLYFLALFTGEEEEALHRLDAARKAYARALALYPQASSALLDLSTLELRNGDRDAASAAVMRMTLTAALQQTDDPWRKYFSAGAGRDADGMLTALGHAIPSRQ